jgi:hypothetical protein
MVFKRTLALTVIADGLGAIKSSCENRGLLHLFDNHTVAQHFFCRLLNAAFDLDLVELDILEKNFPAVARQPARTPRTMSANGSVASRGQRRTGPSVPVSQ